MELSTILNKGNSFRNGDIHFSKLQFEMILSSQVISFFPFSKSRIILDQSLFLFLSSQISKYVLRRPIIKINSNTEKIFYV